MAKKAVAKRPVKKKPAAANIGPRVRNLSRQQKRQKSKKDVRKRPKIPGSFSLTKQVFVTFRKFWKPLAGIFIVYLLLNVVFATGFLSDINATASQIAQSNGLSNAISGFNSLVSSGAANSSASVSLSQSIVIILESLVIIWALRQLLAGESVKVKQAYYQAMTPFVPFILIIFFMILQLLPLILSTAALAVILSSTTIHGVGTAILVVPVIALGLWSFYMLSSSVFALYIVTLPDMQPRQALRSAKKLVNFRRWQIIRRLIFLPICVVVLMGLITVPLIMVASFSVAIVFFVLSMLAVLFIHTYLYSLYRSLL